MADRESFPQFGEYDDAYADEVASRISLVPPARAPSPPAEPPASFVVYERLVDTRLLRSGARGRDDGFALLALVTLVSMVITACLVALSTGVR